MRLIKAQEINAYCRKVSNTPYGTSAMLLLYKDSRYDMAVLDELYGPLGWSVDYKLIKDCLYCTISVYDKETNQWISKTSNGTESNQDPQKGEASDALKRAGFLWGIGRELYTAPQISVPLNQGEFNGNKLNFGVEFHVAEIGYDEDRNINRLVIVDKQNIIRWKWGYEPPREEVKQKAPEKTSQPQNKVSPNAVKAYKDLIHCFGFDDRDKNCDMSTDAVSTAKEWMIENLGEVIHPTMLTEEMVQKIYQTIESENEQKRIIGVRA